MRFYHQNMNIKCAAATIINDVTLRTCLRSDVRIRDIDIYKQELMSRPKGGAGEGAYNLRYIRVRVVTSKHKTAPLSDSKNFQIRKFFESLSGAVYVWMLPHRYT